MNYDLVRIAGNDCGWIVDCQDGKRLLTEFGNCLRITVSHMARLALVARRLEELGVEITIESSILPYVRRIAYGQLLPELFVAFQGKPILLEKAATLPIPDQERIAKNEPVKVMQADGDHRLVPPLEMVPAEIRQVFCRGKIRSDAEQVGYIRTKKTAPVENGDPPISINRSKGGIVVRGVFLSISDLAHYMSELSRKR